MPFDIKAARDEGYSDAEIADYLAGNRGFDIEGAHKEGYSDAEIVSYLSERDATTLGPPKAEPSSRAPRSGMLSPGNIDLNNRKVVKNPDGSVSTVRSISIGTDKGEVLIPTVINGKVVSNDEAIAHYKATGENLGVFDTPENATRYAQKLHQQQAVQYAQPPARVSQPSPHTMPADALRSPFPSNNTRFPGVFDPYGGVFSDGRPPPDPNDYSPTVAGSLAQSFSEDFEAPSGSDWWESLRGSLARQIQGYHLKQLEDLENEILDRRYNVHGEPYYGRSPEDLRRLQDDPLLIEVRKQIAEERATGQAINDVQQDISQRNTGFYPQVVMGATNSVAASAPALATTMVTRNPLAGAAVMYPGTAASAYGEMRDPSVNVPSPIADRAATIEGLLEAGTEYPAMRPLTREASPLIRRFGETLAADVPGETIATLGQDTTRRIAMAQPGETTFDAAAEGLRQGLQDLPVTYGTVLATAGAHAAGARGYDMARAAAMERERRKFGLTPPTPEDLARLMQQIGAPAREEPYVPDQFTGDLSLWPGGPTRDPNLQPELPLGTMPPPDSTGRRAPEAAGGKATAPIPVATQGTAFPKQLADLSSALREPASSRIARAMEQMQVPNAAAAAATNAEKAKRFDELVEQIKEPEKAKQRNAQRLAGLSSKLRQPEQTDEQRLATAEGYLQKPDQAAKASATKQGEHFDSLIANLQKPAPPVAPTPNEPAPAPAPAAPAVSPAQESTGGVSTQIVQAPSAQHMAASVPAAVEALKHPEQVTQIETPGGPVRLVNVGDDTDERVIHAFDAEGKSVGSMYYSTKPDTQPHVAVAPERQKQGIASAMYNLAQKTGGYIPAANAEGQARTPEGDAFRKRREAKQAQPAAAPRPAAQPAQTSMFGPTGEPTVEATPKPAPSEPTSIAPTVLELKPRKKGLAGNDAAIEAKPVKGGFIQRSEAQTPTGGYSTPYEHSQVYPTREAAIAAGAAQVRKYAGAPVRESDQKGEAKARQRILNWVDEVAPEEPQQETSPPDEPPDETPPPDEEMTGQDEDIGTTAAQPEEDTGEPNFDQEFSDRTTGQLREGAPDNLQAGTGKQPTGTAPGSTATPQPGLTPSQRGAARRAAQIREAQARNKTPPRAPKRDQTPGRSNFTSMWQDLFASNDPAGITPESAARRNVLVRRIQNAPLPQQMRLARRRLKNHFAFKDIVIDPKMSPREALDQMLDLYNNGHTMAAIFQQPRQAIGDNGRLTYQLVHSLGSAGTRGMFQWNFAKGPEAGVLSTARQADSFTHEWLHMLDIGMLMRYFKGTKDLGVTGHSDLLRTDLKALPPKLQDAFENLMGAMFLTDKADTKKMIGLRAQAVTAGIELQKAQAKLKATADIVAATNEREQRAQAHIAAGKPAMAKTLRDRTAKAQAELAQHEADVKRLKKQLSDINQEMNTLLKDKATDFHKASLFVDQLGGGKYFSLPAEMLARAGESYMANRANQQVGVEALAGGPDFYNKNADRIMALVYPNENDRLAIGLAFDEFFGALSDEQYFHGDTEASRLPGDTAFSKELYEAAQSSPNVSAFRRLYENKKHDFVNSAIRLKNVFRKKTVAQVQDAIKGSQGAISANLRHKYNSVIGRMQSLIESYKKDPRAAQIIPLLRKFAAKIATNPGAHEEVQPFIAEENINRNMNKWLSVMDRITKRYNLDVGNEEQMRQLFEEYVRPTEQVRQKLQKHLDFLKQHYNDIRNDRNKSSEAASVDRYIKRMEKALERHPESARPPEKIQHAALAMRKLSDELYKTNRDAGIDLGYVSNYMLRHLNHEKIDADEEGFAKQAELAYQMDNLFDHQRLQREAARLEDLVKGADAALKRGVPPTREQRAARTRLAEVKKEMADINALDPAQQAEEYVTSLQMPDLFVPESKTPQQKYTKSRVLGPAADVLMSDYYDQNPITALQAQIAYTAHRSEYAKHFGHDNSELRALRLELKKAGLKTKDFELLDDAVRVAFGTTGSFSGAVDAVGNWVLSLVQSKMLIGSAFTNLIEPFSVSAVTGSWVDGMKAIAHAYLPILHGAKADEHRLVLELLGLQSSVANEQLISNRSGIEFGNQRALQVLRQGFGHISGIHFLTRRGNFAVTHMLMTHTNYLAERMQNGTPQEKKEAERVFREFGIPPERMEKFAEFVRSMPKGRPTSQQLMEAGDAEMKNLYGGMLYRMMRYSMQHPLRVERARGSFDRATRFLFTITSFTMASQRNILVRQGKLMARTEGAGAKIAFGANLALLSATLTAMSMVAMLAREWWMDQERSKKRKLEDFKDWKLWLEAFDRSSQTGMLTTPLNAFMKLKYDKEMYALSQGAVPSWMISHLVDLQGGLEHNRDPLDPLDRSANSPDTNLAERKAWGALYDMTVGIGITPAAIMLDATGPVGWTVATKLNSRGWKDAFAEYMAPKTPTEKEFESQVEKRASMTPEELEHAMKEKSHTRAEKLRDLDRRFGGDQTPTH